jgi:tRNA (guanine-N7-)-methyltransferase
MSDALLKLSSKTLPWPTDWIELFGAARPLIVEIGFGYGTYLLHLARANPDANVIGLEVANKCLTAAENAIERLHLANVRVIHSTAETALYHLFEPATISQVHINFPDPWFKKRHGHRRLMRRETLDAMVNRLAPGGLFYLATDILAYAEMSAELLADTLGLDNMLDTPWASSLPGRFVTKYEAKARRAGRECYYFAYRRNHFPAHGLPVIKEMDMPHLVFTSPLTLDDMLARFERREHAEDGTHIAFLYGYRGEKSLLFEVYVKEPTIDQRVAVMLVERENPNEYTLQLGMLGHPRPTPGIHRAVRLLGEWLVSLHPEARILKNKLQK